jgi:hypothetical protein
VVAALVVLATLGVGSVAQAVWTAGSSVTATVDSGVVGVTVGGFGALDDTEFTTTSPAVGAVAVSFGDAAGATLPVTGFKVAIAATGGIPASKVTLQVWDNGQSASCGSGPPTGAATATWSSGAWVSQNLNWPAPKSSISRGASEDYCVIFSIAGADVTNYAGQSITPALTVFGLDGKWSSASSATAGFTISASAATVVTTGQIGVSDPSSNIDVDDTVDVLTSQNGGSDIDQTTGTIVNQYYFCVAITVTGTNSRAGSWSLQLDGSAAPFNGNLQNFTVVSGNAQLSQSQYGWGWDGKSFRLSGQSIRQNQTITVTLCGGTYGRPAPQAEEGPDTYTVEQPVLAGCPATDPRTHATLNPATPAGAAALTSPIPRGGNGATVCMYVKIDGLYPHFYIGYTATENWSQLLEDSGLSRSQITSLSTATGQWMVYGSDGTNTNVTATRSYDNRTRSYSFTWTETGQALPTAITNGTSVVLVGTFTLPR